MQAAGDSVRILHVDDDPNFAEVTVTFVEQEDERFEVETATSASDGLDRLADDDFDCVVSDYDMPGQNGIEFLERVRRDHPDLPFILFTGKGSEEVASEAISTGVTDYLQKGGSEKYKLLVNRIERAVTESRLQEFRRGMKQDPLALLERFSDPLYAVDEEWRFTYLNRAAEERFGASRGELLDSNLWDAFPEARDTPFYEHYHEALADGQPRTIEEPFEPWDKWFREYIYPSESGLTIISQEITATKQQEFELERNRELLRHVENLTQIGGWEAKADSGQQYWTEGTYRIHDIEPDGNFDPTVEDGIEFYHPDDRETIQEAIEQCIADGIPYEEELRFVTAEGSERWVRTHGEPVRDAGEITAVRGAIQDITEQKRREQELRATKRRLDLALQQASAGIWEWNLETDDLYWDDASLEMFGVSPETFDGHIDAFEERLHPDDKERTEAAMETAIEEGEQYWVEQRIETGDGGYRWFDVRGQVVDDKTRMVGVGFDVTERKRQETQLQRQNERLDTFADVVSHDLRNPLSVVQSRLELARDDCESEHFDPIERAITRMDDLIQNLLTLAREGKEVPELEPVELAILARQCWQNVATADATVRTDIERRVQADRSRLQQLFENLIHNAVEHGGDDVAVTVGELEDGFYVEDDGPGIPADEREDVFEVGYSTTAGGTGLGLSIAKQIADAHGWNIDMTESSDGGARIEITGVKHVD